MSKDYFILNAGRVVYSPGHYEEGVANDLAAQWAQRQPGRTFTVVQVLNKFRVPKKRKT